MVLLNAAGPFSEWPEAIGLAAIGEDLKFLALRIRTLANVGAYVSSFGAQVPEKEAWNIGWDVLQKTGLARYANQPAGSLTLLNRKRLELARALSTRPKLLLLDEIAGGLTEHEAAELVDELKRIKATGVTMIWIEHVVHALLSVADRLFVINFGQQLAEGRPHEVMNDAQVQRVYMGMEV